MKKFLLVLWVAFMTFSCSQYQKALKSEDLAVKYSMAEKLYNDGKYSKALRLFEQIEPKYRGKPQGERTTYFYAMSLYKTEDYVLSGYHMERFVNSFPQSDKVEEVALLGAKSYYFLSPKYSLDQKDTNTALEKLQNFINTYTKSEFFAEANELYQELTGKLERKAFEVARQYNKISEYPASVKAFDNFLSEFPGSSFREDALFYRVDSSFKYAENSVEYRKLERYKETKSAYDKLVGSFPSTKHIEKLQPVINKTKSEIERLTLLTEQNKIQTQQ